MHPPRRLRVRGGFFVFATFIVLLFTFRPVPAHAALASSAHVKTELLRPGDRWLAIGDSITQHAGYQTAILLYHATRFPSEPLQTVANAGIVGDFAGGAVNRYDWDIAPHRATVATVMFGMNDVGQGLYAEIPPTPEQLAKRRAVLDDYRKNLTRLAERLRHDGARLVFVSATPFDETLQSDRVNRPGINAALAECASIMREVAVAQNAAFIDLHTPLTALNARVQTASPTTSIVGPDRIHPGPAGHLAMAYHFLKASGAPALVSEVAIDAAASRVRTAENAEVTALSVSSEAIAFTVNARALPYPIPDDARPALEWVPFAEDLNREMLRVTGLAPGDHALFIDDVEIRRCSAAELAAGVNLALDPTTPQMRQALAVAALAEQWRQLLSLNLRRIALVEYWHLGKLPRPVDFEAARPILEAKLTASPPLDGYTRTAIEGYLVAKPREAGTRREIDALLARLQAECLPRARTYRIVALPR